MEPTILSANPQAAATVAAFSSPLSNNVHVIGSAWVVSSAILTTYSTTSFLKYKKQHKIGSIMPSQKVVAMQEQNSGIIDRPTLLTLWRFSGSFLLGLLFHPDFWNVTQRIQQTLSSVSNFAVPAGFLFVANYGNSVALDRIGIPLTYTSKCGIPLVTVLITFLLDGSQAMPSLPALLSLIPIAAGIAAASWNSPTFDNIGFGAAIISCSAQAALNVSSKRSMARENITGTDAQRTMVAIAFVITAFMTLVQNILQRRSELLTRKESKIASIPKSTKEEEYPPAWLTLFAVASYHIEYCLSFMFVKLVEPITYGTCDAIRRLSIIISGKKMFGGPKFSKTNLFGIGLAVAGALMYSIANSMA